MNLFTHVPNIIAQAICQDLLIFCHCAEVEMLAFVEVGHSLPGATCVADGEECAMGARGIVEASAHAEVAHEEKLVTLLVCVVEIAHAAGFVAKVVPTLVQIAFRSDDKTMQ